VQRRTKQLVEIDQVLLTLLSVYVHEPDPEVAVKTLLRRLLEESVGLFGRDVTRACIYRRAKDECLEVWVPYRMASESVRDARFYVGNDPQRHSGVAGATYKDRVTRRVHIVSRNGQWESDVYKVAQNGKWVRDGKVTYVLFAHDRPQPPYRSFVSVPIIGSAHECLGVLCLDSMNPRVFNGANMPEWLRIVSSRIAAVAMIHRRQVHTLGHQPKIRVHPRHHAKPRPRGQRRRK
jgi:hypothetical protein